MQPIACHLSCREFAHYVCFPAGGIYEYTIELASRGAAPCLERRTAKLAGAVAEELQRNQSSMMEHSPPPGAVLQRTHTAL